MRSQAAAHAVAETLKKELLGRSPRACPGSDAARLYNAPRSPIPLTMRPALGSDAAVVADWLINSDLQFLGGVLDHPPLSQVQGWIDNALGAYILLADSTPIAFFALEHNSDSPDLSFLALSETDVAIELGRLVVAPAHRKKGYGTSLVIHIYRAFLSCLSVSVAHPFHLLVRHTHDNVVCHSFFGRLPFMFLSEVSSDAYCWYISSDYAPYRHPGIALAARRNTERMSQQRLAFLACMDASSLAMVETGHRVLRSDDARRLRSILCHAPADELRYARDILACSFNPDLWAYPAHLSTELSYTHQTLWLFSDVLAENTDADAIVHSSLALLHKCDRFFFVPHAYPLTDIQMICQLFASHFSAQNYNMDILPSQIRFYRAPASLCSLRIAVHDPDPRPGSFSARKLSIAAGNPAMRLDVAYDGDPLLTRFLEQIKKRILYTGMSFSFGSDSFELVDIAPFFTAHTPV